MSIPVPGHPASAVVFVRFPINRFSRTGVNMKLEKTSIAFKLGAVMSIAVIVGFAALTYFSVSFMKKAASEKEVATLQAQVEQVLQVFELYDSTLRQSANAIHRLLMARFPAGFSLDKSCDRGGERNRQRQPQDRKQHCEQRVRRGRRVHSRDRRGSDFVRPQRRRFRPCFNVAEGGGRQTRGRHEARSRASRLPGAPCEDGVHRQGHALQQAVHDALRASSGPLGRGDRRRLRRSGDDGGFEGPQGTDQEPEARRDRLLLRTRRAARPSRQARS